MKQNEQWKLINILTNLNLIKTTQKIWHTIRGATNTETNKKPSYINEIFSNDGTIIKNKHEIASEFNCYFSNIGHGIVSNISNIHIYNNNNINNNNNW